MVPVAIAGLVGSIFGGLVWRALSALAIGFVVYIGFEALLDNVQVRIMSQLSGLPAAIAQILGIMGVDTALNIIFSAYAASIVLGLVGGRKMRLKK